MAKCQKGGHVAVAVYRCSYCGKSFCTFHNDPVEHGCKKYEKWRKKVLGG